MAPLWEQKRIIKDKIRELIMEYMQRKPDKAGELAEGACIRLASKMTLAELAIWESKLILLQANDWK